MPELIGRIVERLEGEKATDYYLKPIKNEVLDEAISIIREEAAAYNNGWIRVEDGMPEEQKPMFAKFKGTPKWSNAMFEKASAKINVTVADENGKTVTTDAMTTDGTWKCDLLKMNPKYKIIAWKPLPEPYKQAGGQKCLTETR